MSRAKKPKAPVLWVVLDKDDEATTQAPLHSRAAGEEVVAICDRWSPEGRPHRVVKYVPEEKKR